MSKSAPFVLRPISLRLKGSAGVHSLALVPVPLLHRTTVPLRPARPDLVPAPIVRIKPSPPASAHLPESKQSQSRPRPLVQPSTMQFSSFILTLSGLFTILAAADQCTGNKSNTGYCEVLTYEDRTVNNKSPPSTSQCEASCKSVLTDAGDWSVSFKGQPAGYVQRMVNSDCSFSVGRVSICILCLSAKQGRLCD